VRHLVTGGAGFIGSHLVDRLLVDGHDVVVIDDLSNGREANLRQHSGNARLHFVRADCAEYESIRPHFDGVNAVFHIAGLADIVPSIERPLRYHRANVDGTANVLEAARSSGVAKLVYAASSSCYGIPDAYPTAETAPARPQYPYALTKYLGEQEVMHWGQVYKLPVVSLRLFNVYGPRSRTSGTYGAVFGVFLAQKLKGQPFTVVGDGTQTRDFTFVTDVVDAFVKAAESPVHQEVMNVGSGNTYSVNRLVELLGGPKVYVPKRPGEPDSTFADISKIRKLLGWQPKVSLEQGVRLMLEHINDWHDAPVWTPEKVADATRGWFKYLGEGKQGAQLSNAPSAPRQRGGR
jgi:UDP-glucose 4-epimerase